jgi:Sulfotransferase family
MTVTSVAFRAVIRTLNAAERSLGRMGVRSVTLDERTLLEAACRQAALQDFGDGEFRAALRVLLQDYETEAHLTLLGRFVARRDTVSLLAHRLQIQEDRRRHPAIGDERIDRPLVIMGLPRTGSTLLHHLLAQDPANRVAQAWEVMAPSPPPEGEDHTADPRIDQVARDLRWLDRLAPAFKTIHPLGARLPLECMAIMSHSFLSQRFHTMYRVPNYQAWLGRQDLRPAYHFHRRFLQHLQYRRPGRRWILKAPSHAHGVDALCETYPDAVVVQTHRDPVAVLSSVASLTAVLRGAFSDHVDLSEIGSEVAQHWSDGLERLFHSRADRGFGSERFFDVHYRELVEDPLATVRRLYANFDLPVSAAAEARMRQHLAENPKDKYGSHAYSLATFGLDPDDLRHRFKAYTEYFGIQSEPEAR